MEKYLPVLQKTKLFTGIDREEIQAMLSCLGTRVRTYQRGEIVFRQGEKPGSLAVLAEGNLLIQKDDYWGNRSIVNSIVPGEMFGEAYVAPDSGGILNDVVATCNSTVILFDAGRVITTCSTACRFHAMVVQNLFFALSEKNRSLVQKLEHLSRRTIREKLISYLSEQAKSRQSGMFEIPFNRQQLADFLSIDRSAMSKELCKMRDEGLLEFQKNRFRLR